jgi:hypothetical protein
MHGLRMVRWRHAMAGWAQTWSKPMCAEIPGLALAAPEDDRSHPPRPAP